MGHSYLSPKAKTRNSEISGKGSYAVAKIIKDEIIAIFGGNIMDTNTWYTLDHRLGSLALPLDEEFLIGPSSDSETGDGDFVNHSCNPNAGLNGHVYLVALRDIDVGEEITFDYAMILSDMLSDDCEFDCNCSHNSCRRTITANDWKDPLLQERYKGYFSHYIQVKIDKLSVKESISEESIICIVPNK